MSIRQTATRDKAYTDTPEGAGGWEEAEGRVSSPLPEPGLAPGTAREQSSATGLLGAKLAEALGDKTRIWQGKDQQEHRPPGSPRQS